MSVDIPTQLAHASARRAAYREARQELSRMLNLEFKKIYREEWRKQTAPPAGDPNYHAFLQRTRNRALTILMQRNAIRFSEIYVARRKAKGLDGGPKREGTG